MPIAKSPGLKQVLPNSSQSANKTDTLIHHEHTTNRFAFKMDKIENVYNVKNQNWKELHDSMMSDKSREIFDMDVLVHQLSGENTDSPTLNIHVYKKCITELLLLDDTKVLSLFDTGSKVNLISECFVKSSEYLSSMHVMECGTHKIQNTTGIMNASKVIEICLKVKDDFILSTTTLIVSDFGSVKFILSTTSMIQLNSIIDISSQEINIRKKSFAFRTNQHCKIKANDSTVIGIKCTFPKFLRNSDFLDKPFRPFTKFLPYNFLLKLKRGQSYIKIINHTSRSFNMKGNTALGSVKL